MYCRHRRLIISPLRRAIATRSCFSTLENNADPICELASSTLRYGPTSTSEVGQDLAYMNAKRILLFVDPYIAAMDPFHNVVSSIEKHVPAGHFLDIYDKIRVEPNNESFKHAIEFMSEKTRNHGPYDAIIALGGGSTIDTAKAANLYTCYPPDDFYDYVNPPLGKGLPVPGPIVPLIAIPTTSGTGSETTGVAIFDDVPTKSKTGIAHRRLKPTLGIVDPDNTKTMSPPVAKYSGIDVLCHAIESYTAIPYTSRASGRPISPILRPAYQGSNPISDIWALHSLRDCCRYLSRIVNNPLEDSEARAKMCLAASTAGMGFGNAGVHLCHGMSYAVASQVKQYWVDGYPQLNDIVVGDVGNDHGLVPHGLSVVINAPSVFKFTGSNLDENDPIQKRSVDRHVECAIILANARLQRRGDNVTTIGQEVTSEKAMRDKPGDALANELLELMNDLEIPIGLRSLGYSEADVEELAKGTLPQHRVTKLSPRQPVELEELTALFKDAL
jgi:hydroxyacid-oxoacid transhydrogenase